MSGSSRRSITLPTVDFTFEDVTCPSCSNGRQGALFALGAPCVQASATCEHNIELTAVDRETLLVNWLNELLYLQEANNECYGQVEITSDTALSAIVRGSPATKKRRVIKAVTFHNMRINQVDEGLEATIVVDV